MGNVFEDVQRGTIYNGEIYVKKEKPKVVPKKEAPASYKVTPYYDGGMHLETYGENKFRGIVRHVSRKTPVVARDIISTGKQTFVPMFKGAGKQILRAGLAMGENEYREMQRKRGKGLNPYW